MPDRLINFRRDIDVDIMIFLKVYFSFSLLLMFFFYELKTFLKRVKFG